ncbi:MAG: RING finger protein [Phycisphaerae bacterium]|nr:RING finger protein [Phycisphaerae bacterium]
MELLIVLVMWLVQALFFASLAASIAGRKNAGRTAFWMGFWLGPLGAILAGFLDERRQCATCGTRLERFAKICPSCRAKISAAQRQSPDHREERRLVMPGKPDAADEADVSEWLRAPEDVDLSLDRAVSDEPIAIPADSPTPSAIPSAKRRRLAQRRRGIPPVQVQLGVLGAILLLVLIVILVASL